MLLGQKRIYILEILFGFWNCLNLDLRSTKYEQEQNSAVCGALAYYSFSRPDVIAIRDETLLITGKVSQAS